MFSTPDAASRRKVVQTLRDRISKCRSAPSPSTKSLLAAETVAFQILREALIPPEEAVPRPLAATSTSFRNRLASPTRGGTPTGAAQDEGLGKPRSNSVSKTYDSGLGKGESALREANKAVVAPSPNLLAVAGTGHSAGGRRRGSKEEVEKIGVFAQNGMSIVVVTEQNSLLPLVLTFLGEGAEAREKPTLTFPAALPILTKFFSIALGRA